MAKHPFISLHISIYSLILSISHSHHLQYTYIHHYGHDMAHKDLIQTFAALDGHSFSPFITS